MAFLTGRMTQVVAGGYDLSPFLNASNVQKSRTAHRTTTYRKASHTYIPGQRDGSMSLGGYFDHDADGAIDTMSEILEAAFPVDEVIITRGVAGLDTIANVAEFCRTRATAYEVGGGDDEPVTVSIETQANGGIDRGIVLHPLTGETVDGNGASQDNAASSANGGAATLHLTGITGTSIVVKVQHSTDASTWVDLITFTSMTAVGAQHLEVTGTVNRYVRATWDVTGAGTYTFVVAFARRSA